MQYVYTTKYEGICLFDTYYHKDTNEAGHRTMAKYGSLWARLVRRITGT